MSKKGAFEFEGLAYIIVLIFAFVLTAVFVKLVVSNFDEGIQNSNSSLLPAETKQISADYNSGFNAFDTGFALLLLASWVTVIILIRSSPERNGWFIVVGVVACLIFGLLGFVLENLWFGLNTGEIASATSDWVFVPFFLDYFIAVLVFYILSFLFAGMTSDGGISFGG